MEKQGAIPSELLFLEKFQKMTVQPLVEIVYYTNSTTNSILPTVQAGADIAGKIAMHVKRLEVYLFLSGIRRSTSMCLPTTTTTQV